MGNNCCGEKTFITVETARELLVLSSTHRSIVTDEERFREEEMEISELFNNMRLISSKKKIRMTDPEDLENDQKYMLTAFTLNSLSQRASMPTSVTSTQKGSLNGV